MHRKYNSNLEETISIDFAPRSHKRLTLLIEDAKTTRQRYQIHPFPCSSSSIRACKYPADVQFLYHMQHCTDAPIKDKLRYVRLMAGLKQSELAEMVGISRSTLLHLENGDVSEENMKTNTLIRIALACGFERTFCCNPYHALLAGNIGQRIKAYRKEHRMTQQVMADIFHVCKGTVFNWEHNQTNPPKCVLQRLFPEPFAHNKQSDDQE